MLYAARVRQALGRCLGHNHRYTDSHGNVVLALGRKLSQGTIRHSNNGVATFATNTPHVHGLYDIPINRIICGIQFLAVKSEEHVAVAETGILHLLAEIHTLGHCMEGNYIIAPVQRYAHIYHNGKHELEAHAGYHYAHRRCHADWNAVPSSELRREVVGTLGFIYHAAISQ